eukprot:scaffold4256_cov56-Isochrysis_galbana.AAC.1
MRLDHRARNLVWCGHLRVQLPTRPVLALGRLVGLGLAGGQQADDDALALGQRSLSLGDCEHGLD